MRYLAFFVFFILTNVIVFAQEVTAIHDVQPSDSENSYTIKTNIKGLQGTDIARISYLIDNSHTYNASPNNAFFSDRNEKFVKFYIMAIPASGEINIELGITLSGANEYSFPVEFQYSRNEEKKSIQLPQISIVGAPIAVIEEEVKEAVEEEKIVEETVVEETVVEETVVEETVVEETVVEETVVEETVVEENLEAKIKAEEQAQLALEAKEKAEAEKLAAEEAKKEEELAKQKEEQMAQEEAESAALAKLEEERIEKEKVEKEAATKRAEEEALAKLEEEKVVEEATLVEGTPPPASSANYSIQILSLSKFSQTRLNIFIKQHNLDAAKIIKRQVGQWTKVSYGKLNSKDEVREMIQKLRRNHNITDGFMVTMP